MRLCQVETTEKASRIGRIGDPLMCKVVRLFIELFNWELVTLSKGSNKEWWNFSMDASVNDSKLEFAFCIFNPPQLAFPRIGLLSF